MQLGLAMLSVLLLFTLVLIHEFAHSIVAQIRGYKVHSITLFMLGGVSNIHSEATKARDEFYNRGGRSADQCDLFLCLLADSRGGADQ